MPLTQTEWDFVNDGSPLDSNPNYRCTIVCTDQNITLSANLPAEFTLDIGANYEEAFAQAMSQLPIFNKIAPGARAVGIQLSTQALTAQVWQGSTELAFNLPLVFQIERDSEADILKPLRDLYALVLPDESSPGGFLTAPGPRLDATLLVKSISAGASAFLNSPLSSLASAAAGAGNVISGLNNSTEFTTALQSLANAVGIGGVVASAADKAFSIQQKLTSASAGAAGTTLTGAQAIERAAGFNGNGAKPGLVSAVKNNISLQIGKYMFFESVVITNVNQTHYVQPVADGTMSRVEVTVSFKTFFVPTKADIIKIFAGGPGSNGISSGGRTSGSSLPPGNEGGGATGSSSASSNTVQGSFPSTVAPSGSGDTGLLGKGASFKIPTLADLPSVSSIVSDAANALTAAAKRALVGAPAGSSIDPVTGNVLQPNGQVDVARSQAAARETQYGPGA